MCRTVGPVPATGAFRETPLKLSLRQLGEPHREVIKGICQGLIPGIGTLTQANS